jgi:hypothetical protein
MAARTKRVVVSIRQRQLERDIARLEAELRAAYERIRQDQDTHDVEKREAYDYALRVLHENKALRRELATWKAMFEDHAERHFRTLRRLDEYIVADCLRRGLDPDGPGKLKKGGSS